MPEQAEIELDVLVLGAGFGGMHILHNLRELGLKVLALEGGSGVGGTWFWNRYPGARCDVESLVYCYSFSPIIDSEWRWSERYAAQPEILRYLNFVCDRLGLRKDIRLNERLIRARWDEEQRQWHFVTESGGIYRARHFVSAAGPINTPVWPDIPGREHFRGQIHHTARWPQEDPDFTGKRVGVIGTGSSGTQLIPLVAEQAEHLTVFVRTAGFHANAHNRPLTEMDHHWWEANRDRVRAKLKTAEIYGTGDLFMPEELFGTRYRQGDEFTPQERRRILERRWEIGGASMPRAFADIMTNFELNAEVCGFLREKVFEVVEDPETAAILMPAQDLYYGTKRICVGTNFYETFNRPNVTAISVRDRPLERFTEKGLVTGGEKHEFDAIICASGFDALTGSLSEIEIIGADGRTIREAWARGAVTWLGYGVAGFPNLHLIGGPGSPSIIVNVIMANEYQVDWLTRFFRHMEASGITRAEVRRDAQQRWSDELNKVIKGTVLETANSWYTGANVPGKPKQFMAYAGGVVRYREACESAAAAGYEGFDLK